MTPVEKSPFFAPSTRSYSQQQQSQQPKQPYGTSMGGVHNSNSKIGTNRSYPGITTQGATVLTNINMNTIPKEKKSSITGATANLINAIVGSGIVGIPYAIQQAGLVTGIGLICLCAILTDKSLRLLIATAKHANAPSYETTMEAAFGTWGFRFVTINMFIMSYGAMLSYLMIVKDTLPYLLLGQSTVEMRRALLFVISVTIMLPLSAQRDMANLATTSRISVACDAFMVLLVAYLAPISNTLQTHGGYWNVIQSSTLRLDTVFVGLGVLSFAFVCQHSAFIIAGSLERPTQERWSKVTFRSLWVCACLANVCGISGYLGYMESTQGNVLNNLPRNDSIAQATDDHHRLLFLANIARGLLGTTMLFVFPMELFVSRHVCVVTLFQGRHAHEGDDALILNRRDRRWSLTVILYLLALIPAMAFENVGNVLSVTGAVGGSCLSYLGPGLVYLGIHGAEFLEWSHKFWNMLEVSPQQQNANMGGRVLEVGTHEEEDDRQPLNAVQKFTATSDGLNDTSMASAHNNNIVRKSFSMVISFVKTILWYLWGMPLWYAVAKYGADGFRQYNADLLTKSPHPSRLGHVKHMSLQLVQSRTLKPPLVRSNSFQERMMMANAKRSIDDSFIRTLPKSGAGAGPTQGLPTFSHTTVNNNSKNTSNNDDDDDEEVDPQLAPPNAWDFLIAMAFCWFGIIALCAGLFSIFVQTA